MRHPLAPALAVLLLLAAYAAGGAVLAAGGPGDRVAVEGTVTGTVTDEGGTAVADAYVVLEPADGDLLAEHTDGERAVAESLLKLAGTDPDGVTVVRTGDDGAFETSLPDGSYRVVAVSADGERVSRLRTVETGTRVDLVADPHRVLEVSGGTAGPVEPGATAAVAVVLRNPDDDPVRNLTVSVGELPDGWTLTGVDTNGSYDAGSRTLTWASAPAGERVVATLHVAVRADAERGQYQVPLAATADAHFVESMDEGTVVVRPENATPTPTSVGGPGETDEPIVTTTPPPHTATTAPPGEGPVTVPGYRAPVTVAVLVALAALLAGRRRAP